MMGSEYVCPITLKPVSEPILLPNNTKIKYLINDCKLPQLLYKCELINIDLSVFGSKKVDLDCKNLERDLALMLGVIESNFDGDLKRLLREDNREKERVIVRQCVYYYLRTKEKLSHSKCARRYYQDHSTVIYSVKQVEFILRNEFDMYHKPVSHVFNKYGIC